jgi:hypothetical protein
MEDQIEKLKKENSENSKKVRVLKNTQILQSKELEVCSVNKKYPQKISEYTEEVKKLVAKKHEYFGKLTSNKKSIINLKIYLGRVNKHFMDIMSNPKYKNEITGKSIETEINKIFEELSGTEEEILERINGMSVQGISGGQNNNILLKAQFKKNTHLTTRKILENKKSQSPSHLPEINNNKKLKSKIRISSNSPGYRGIFNKYEYLSTRERTSGSIQKKSSLPAKIDNSDIDYTDELYNDEEIISLDYENTYESDYSNLFKKREQLEKINSKLEKNIKEVEKLFEKKFKDLTNSIEHNQKKLKLMKQQNELLSVEITDLTKIIKLNLEESKLKKEIKESESKIQKSMRENTYNNTHNNDVSETRNDILQELNNILIAEGERVNKFKSNKTLQQTVIQEDKAEANSILDDNQVENENKNLKCKFIYKFSS